MITPSPALLLLLEQAADENGLQEGDTITFKILHAKSFEQGGRFMIVETSIILRPARQDEITVQSE